MTLVSAWGRPEWEASLVMLPLSLAIAIFSGGPDGSPTGSGRGCC